MIRKVEKLYLYNNVGCFYAVENLLMEIKILV